MANINFLANENENIPEMELRRGNRGLLISFLGDISKFLNAGRRLKARIPHVDFERQQCESGRSSRKKTRRGTPSVCYLTPCCPWILRPGWKSQPARKYRVNNFAE